MACLLVHFQILPEECELEVFHLGQGVTRLTIFRTFMPSACLLSVVFLLTGCGHLINRLI